MKKMMKKIKSNSFLSKIIAILTICMVLLSSLSVSAFAADDVVSAANEETESITDVWTSVMNWITSSLTSAQGVFVSSDFSGTINLDLFAQEDSYDTYSISGFNFDGFDGQNITLFSPMGSIDFILAPSSVDPSWLASTSSFEGFEFRLVFIPFEGDGSWFITIPSALSGFPSSLGFFASSLTFGLTFLGTLAVIGVAIAIAFLLISVFSRFLRLRG